MKFHCAGTFQTPVIGHSLGYDWYVKVQKSAQLNPVLLGWDLKIGSDLSDYINDIWFAFTLSPVYKELASCSVTTTVICSEQALPEKEILSLISMPKNCICIVYQLQQAISYIVYFFLLVVSGTQCIYTVSKGKNNYTWKSIPDFDSGNSTVHVLAHWGQFPPCPTQHDQHGASCTRGRALCTSAVKALHAGCAQLTSSLTQHYEPHVKPVENHYRLSTKYKCHCSQKQITLTPYSLWFFSPFPYAAVFSGLFVAVLFWIWQHYIGFLHYISGTISRKMMRNFTFSFPKPFVILCFSSTLSNTHWRFLFMGTELDSRYIQLPSFVFHPHNTRT